MPVEAAAPLRGPGQHRDENRAKERLVAGVADPRVGAREDRRRGLPLQIVDRVARVRQPPQRRRLLLDEAAHERPVLVERRPFPGRMLLERERDLRAALGRERRRGRTRAATRRDAGREARPGVTRAAGRLLPGTPGTSRSCGCRRPGPTSESAHRSAGTAARRGGRPGGRHGGRRRPTRASAPPPPRARGGDPPPARRAGGATVRARARHSASASHMFPIPATSD